MTLNLGEYGTWANWTIPARAPRPTSATGPVTFDLRPDTETPVVAYLFGLLDHRPGDRRVEEAQVLRQHNRVWAAVWSTITGPDPDLSHVPLSPTVVAITPGEAIDRLALMGISSEQIAIPEARATLPGELGSR